jgi:hypothetical protein
VLFLDDPESELDPRWIGPLLGLIPESAQTVVTTCRPLSEAPARFRHLKMDTLGAGTQSPAAHADAVEASA